MAVGKLKRKRPAGAGFPIGDGALDAVLNEGDVTKVSGGQALQNDLDAEGPALAEAFAACLRFSEPHLSTEGSRLLPDVSELKELKGIMKQLQERVGTLQGSVDTIGERFADTAKGAAPGHAGYVEMKVQLMLSYVVCLVYYLLLKTRGVPVRDHPVVLRLHWLRSLLEKLRPVDQRLRYEMGKLVSWADARRAEEPGGGGEAQRAHEFKPGELTAGVEDEDEEAGETAAPAAEEDGIYRPPKISQVEYTGDHVTEKERAERELDRKRRRLEQSEFMKSLREEFTDAPAEVRGELKSAAQERAERQLAERREYEEDNLIRVRVKKKELRKERQLLRQGRSTAGGAVSLEDVADVRAIASGIEAETRGGRIGKGRRGGGSALQEYQAATHRARNARRVAASPLDAGLLGDARGGKQGAGKSGGKIRKSRR